MVEHNKSLEYIANTALTVMQRTCGAVGVAGIAVLTAGCDGGIGWLAYQGYKTDGSDEFTTTFLGLFAVAAITIAGYNGIKKVLELTGWYSPNSGYSTGSSSLDDKI